MKRPGKCLKISAKILIFRDISTYYTTLKISHGKIIVGSDNQIITVLHTLTIGKKF